MTLTKKLHILSTCNYLERVNIWKWVWHKDSIPTWKCHIPLMYMGETCPWICGMSLILNSLFNKKKWIVQIDIEKLNFENPLRNKHFIIYKHFYYTMANQVCGVLQSSVYVRQSIPECKRQMSIYLCYIVKVKKIYI